LDDTLTTPDDSSFVQTFGKSITGEDSVTMQSTSTVFNIGKALSTSYSGMSDAISVFD
jgi:hypothetical protein